MKSSNFSLRNHCVTSKITNITKYVNNVQVVFLSKLLALTHSTQKSVLHCIGSYSFCYGQSLRLQSCSLGEGIEMLWTIFIPAENVWSRQATINPQCKIRDYLYIWLCRKLWWRIPLTLHEHKTLKKRRPEQQAPRCIIAFFFKNVQWHQR